MRNPKCVRIALFIVATITVIGGAGCWVWDQWGPRAQMEEKARADWGFFSIVERLPKGKGVAPKKPLDEESTARWQGLDAQLATDSDGQAQVLKDLHERTRRFFVSYPGTGAGRGFWPDRDAYLHDYQEDVTEDQPGMPADYPLSTGEKFSQVKTAEEFHRIHQLGLTGFLNPFGFGYLKDREHVAGFKSHGFRYNTTRYARSDWSVDHIHLVGILTQNQPIVYLTDKMPSMDQIRQGKTRGLDFFEEAALPKLCDGEDLYIVRKNDTIRMLGAIRATKTCQRCHDAEIGDLLGAFSYTLRPLPVEAMSEG